MITINTNTTAMVAQNNLTTTQGNLNSSMLKLSTGLRINSASDDAAGMQISNRMETQVNGLGIAQRNANDAISMAQTAEGAMVEVTDMLNRMRDLSLQSANSTNTADDRGAMQKEVDALKAEITRVNETTNFAGINLLDGSSSNLSFQVGSNANEIISLGISEISTTSLKGSYDAGTVSIGADDVNAILLAANGETKADGTASGKDADGNAAVPTQISVGGVDSTLSLATDGDTLIDAATLATNLQAAITADGTLGAAGITVTEENGSIVIKGGTEATDLAVTANGNPAVQLTKAGSGSVSSLSLTSAESAQQAVDILDGALAMVDDQRANLGAVQNRLESTIDNLGNIEQNMTASQSRIKDVDFAKETTNMTSQQMMMQAGSTVLAQAKQMPQYAAQLMG